MASDGRAGNVTSRGLLNIDLGAITENYLCLQREAPNSEMAAVVKADAYGLGAKEVALALSRAGCDTFFIAHPDEGVALREILPSTTIYVLNGLSFGTEKDMVAAGLIPVLNHPGELERYVKLAQMLDRPLPAAIQIDTGMMRLGFSAAEIERVEGRGLDGLDLRLVMSHLAVAENPSHPLNGLQLERFRALRARLPDVVSSLANSSGIFLGASFQQGLCRPGVALYGVNPTPKKSNPMRPVVGLRAPVLQVLEAEEAGTVGYGASYHLQPGGRIATVPVGYADGYIRAAGDGAKARIANEIVPVAGRVSMDLITLDISALPPGRVRPGGMVDLIWGPDGVDDLAMAAGTIGYEVLTRLGSRFARRYTQGETSSA